MNARKPVYTTQLSAGLGLVDETKLLLSLCQKDPSTNQLYKKALESGLFPTVSARRLRKIVAECFAPRYIKTGVAQYLKPLSENLPSSAINQLFLIYTANANDILQDFIQEIYWECYSGGSDSLSTDEAKDFVVRAIREGKATKPWSDIMIKRVSSYLIGCCADYGLLSSGRGPRRTIQPVRIQEFAALFLAYKLHFDGKGDNAVTNHKAWALFGLNGFDVREELKCLAKNGWLIVQSASDVTCISWQLKTMEAVVDVITQR